MLTTAGARPIPLRRPGSSLRPVPRRPVTGAAAALLRLRPGGAGRHRPPPQQPGPAGLRRAARIRSLPRAVPRPRRGAGRRGRARRRRPRPPPAAFSGYDRSRASLAHAAEIRSRYGYTPFGEGLPHWRFLRWLYERVWTGAERPTVLVDLSTAWLVENRVLLPGITTLTRLVARVRDRAAHRSWGVVVGQLRGRPAPARRSARGRARRPAAMDPSLERPAASGVRGVGERYIDVGELGIDRAMVAAERSLLVEPAGP